MTQSVSTTPSLTLYTTASEEAAAQIIRAYSTSFGIATRILGERHRRHIRNLYALVRVADELVDGVAAEAHLSAAEQLEQLNALEAQTDHAIASGYSSNPIVQAFANSARLACIDRSLTEPFFASMRMDLRTPEDSNRNHSPSTDALVGFNEADHAEYVYGSAEVVGLMCLRVFLRNEQRSPEELATLEQGARSLGAAFQNINFMRDLADDTERLSRSYLSDGRGLDERLKVQWIETVRAQLRDAKESLPLLPGDARTGVDCAYRFFSKLTDTLESTPADELLRRRVRVSSITKVRLIAQSLTAARRSRTPRSSNSSGKI